MGVLYGRQAPQSSRSEESSIEIFRLPTVTIIQSSHTTRPAHTTGRTTTLASLSSSPNSNQPNPPETLFTSTNGPVTASFTISWTPSQTLNVPPPPAQKPPGLTAVEILGIMFAALFGLGLIAWAVFKYRQWWGVAKYKYTTRQTEKVTGKTMQKKRSSPPHIQKKMVYAKAVVYV